MKINFYSFLYILCIVSSFFPNYEVTFLIWLFTVLVTLKKKYSTTIVNFIGLFSVVLITATLSTLFYEYPTFSVIKDFTYLLKPILGLLVGYQIFDKFKSKNFDVFINAGLILSAIHIILIFAAFIKYQSVDMNLIRYEAGFFSDYEVYVFVLLLFSSKFNIEIDKKTRTVYLLVIGFSVFMYLARTNFLQLAILILGIKGYYVLTRKSVKVLSFTVIAVLLSYSTIYYSNPKRNGKGIEALMYKIKIAPEEAFKTKINKDDWKDFNDNYRSFENITTVKRVSAEGTRAIVFGKGIGSTVKIGQKIYTTDGSIITHFAVAHNGFMTIFLKSGLLGVLLLIVFLYLLYKQKRSEYPIINNINMLLMGTAVFLILSTWVFMGVYFKLDNKSIIIGLIIAMREYLLKTNVHELK
ncbi:hypothetical protein [Flavobacterium soli]|uniref:hypothetical protein n=1 Tax=Flavobacterium soli TaxID=344881 RepID=UPI0003F9FE37|nr:hypothetical protein [Flavobacterium soli]